MDHVEESLTSSGGPQWTETWARGKAMYVVRFGQSRHTMQGEGGVIGPWFWVIGKHDSLPKDIFKCDNSILVDEISEQRGYNPRVKNWGSVVGPID